MTYSSWAPAPPDTRLPSTPGAPIASPLLIDGPQPGGQLTITSEVENYPGFKEGILGPELMERMRAQAIRFGTEMVTAVAERVDFSNVHSRCGPTAASSGRTPIIVATGASAKLTGCPGEQLLMGLACSACATCDGFFFTASASSWWAAATRRWKRRRTDALLQRDHGRASPRYVARIQDHADRALANPKIRFIWDSEVSEILDPAAKKVTAVRLRNLKDRRDQRTSHRRRVHGDRASAQHGVPSRSASHRPARLLLVEPATTKTTIEGVFAPATCRLGVSPGGHGGGHGAAWRRSTPSVPGTKAHAESHGGATSAEARRQARDRAATG
jgi:thioredoxin reductase (NADPH)